MKKSITKGTSWQDWFNTVDQVLNQIALSK